MHAAATDFFVSHRILHSRLRIAWSALVPPRVVRRNDRGAPAPFLRLP
jgi:hypothetical protein